MKYAIVSVSKEGAQLGVRVKAGISGEGTLYERKDGASGKEAVYFTRTLALTADIFSCYDGILFIMASGIAVRAIAPHVVSKASDPAVLVMDECGKHCVSLLSGHLGGANAWAREVSAAVGADPVITTATDVHNRRAPDDIARELMMRVEPLAALKPVNTVIAAGRTFRWFLDETVEGSASIATRLKEKGIRTSIFIDPSPAMAEGAKACGVDRVELYTADYALNYPSDREKAIAPYLETAKAVRELGLGLNAGHDLSLENLEYFIRTIPWTDEVSIGHAIICDALYMGLEKTIQAYLSKIKFF